MYRSLLVYVFAALAGCVSFSPGAPEGQVDVIAHRGASAYAPENTMAAFRLAEEMDAHWFELDCTLTKDNEVIVIHDDTLDRTTKSSGPVSGVTLGQLDQLEAGAWFDDEFAGEPLPTLAEALRFAKGKIGVYVEIKNSDDDRELMNEILALAEGHENLFPALGNDVMTLIEESETRNLPLTRETIAEIERLGVEDEVVIQSFSPIVCAIALWEAPHIRTELLASSNDENPAQWEHFVEWEGLLEPAGFNINKKDATPQLINEFHDRGKTVAVWTVNDPADMERFARMGVDAIITDKPDVCIEVLEGAETAQSPRLIRSALSSARRP